MKILFWNINKKPQDKTDAILELIRLKDPDIFFIAESNNAFDLGKINYDYVKVKFRGEYGSNKMSAFVKKEIKVVNRDFYLKGRIGVCEIIFDGKRISICGVHFFSKMDMEHNQRKNEGLLRSEINNILNVNDHAVFIGDFNNNPYDERMYSLYGFNAIPWKDDVNSLELIQDGSDKHFLLYNPMWNFLGDASTGASLGVKGTHKFQIGGSLDWHFLDQIVCSKNLIPYLKDESIEIISHLNIASKNEDLLQVHHVKKKPHFKFSDHYPIFCNLDLTI